MLYGHAPLTYVPQTVVGTYDELPPILVVQLESGMWMNNGSEMDYLLCNLL
jgi:hypothetical protein